MRRLWPMLAVVILVVAGLATLRAGLLRASDQGTVVAPPEQPLRAARYRFCHEAGFDGRSARAFCDLLDDAPDDLCPGLRATCEGSVEVFEPKGGCVGGGPPGGTIAADPDKPRESLEPELAWLETLRAWLPWVSAAFVGLVLVVVARAVLLLLFRRRLTRPQANAASLSEPKAEVARTAPSAADPLAAAWQALDAGEVERAVFLARDVAVARLVTSGRLPDHPWDTDRARVRRLRPAAGWEHLRVLVHAVERARWAGQRLSMDAARRAVDAATRLLGMWLALVLVPGTAEAWERHGALGDAALHELLEADGHEVRAVNGPLSDLTSGDGDVLLLSLLGVRPDEAGWDAVFDFAEAGGLVVVAGHDPAVERRFGRRVAWLSASMALESTEAMSPLDLPIPRWSPGPSELFCGGDAVPWVVPSVYFPDCEAPYAVGAFELGVGAVVVISDARLLTNAALVSNNNRAFLLGLLRAVVGWAADDAGALQVRLALLSREGAPSPMASMANARLLPLLIQVMLLFALIALWRGWPMAPLRAAPEQTRRELSEHADALANHWERLGATRLAARRLAALQLQRHGASGLRALVARGDHDPAEADAFVDAVEALAHAEDASRPLEDHERKTLEELWHRTR